MRVAALWGDWRTTMIGTKDTQIIAGFEMPRYEMNGVVAVPKNIGVLRVENHVKVVLAALDAAQEAIADAINRVKKAEGKAKADLEQQKNDKMASISREGERQSYLFNTFVPGLRTIGLSKAKLETEFGKLKVVTDFKQRVKQLPVGNFGNTAIAWTTGAKTWECTMTVLGDKFTLVRLYQGDSGYEVSIPKGTGGVQRAVYAKKLGLLSARNDFKKGPNQYVKDDNGVLTRRYAYDYKTLGACKHLMEVEGGALKGRYVAQGKEIKSIDPALRGMYSLDQSKTALMKEEVVFVNQEKGSGDQQRGICLSSSPDKVIHGNKGETFEFDKDTNKPNVLLKVDLAQVSEGQEVLFNLYSQDAQKLTIGLAGKKPTGDPFDSDWAKWHTDTSTAKNREIYLRELSKEQVANADHVLSEIERISKL